MIEPMWPGGKVFLRSHGPYRTQEELSWILAKQRGRCAICDAAIESVHQADTEEVGGGRLICLVCTDSKPAKGAQERPRPGGRPGSGPGGRKTHIL